MANFGFERLSVVAPYEPHWREAKSAVGASDLLQNARITENLADAVAECTLVIGTASLARRKPEQPVLPLPELASLIQKEFAHGGRVALVFGSEKRGLTLEDLAHCQVITEIPTDPVQPSMNLGQAVAILLYEIATGIAQISPEGNLEGESTSPASTRDLERLAGVIEETMLAEKYSPASMRKANRHDLDLLVRRLSLTAQDARRILGFFRRILWRLRS